jgi:hypothetical protein
LRSGIDPAGIHAHPEGGIDQIWIAGRQRQRRIHLVGGGGVVMILLGDTAGELAAVERCRDLAAALRLGVDRRRKRQDQRNR